MTAAIGANCDASTDVTATWYCAPMAKQVKPIPVTQTIRVAVTGKEVGFGIYETLAILGRERCLARIDRSLKPGEPAA